MPFLPAGAPVRSLGLLVALATVGCDGPAGLVAGTNMQLTVEGLRPLDPSSEGTYELWMYPTAGAPLSAGRFRLPSDTRDDEPASIPFNLPLGSSARIAVTVEPPGDADGGPSSAELLSGWFDGRTARLTIEGSVTDGRPLQRAPGHHSLFTSSNNVELGYPSFENAGLWLFSISVAVNPHKTREVKLTPLSRGWLYEGWIVYRAGTANERWISYGKFRPDIHSLLTSRDNTGSGAFSGDEDFLISGVEDVPGEEWTTPRVAELLDLRMPYGFVLPLALDAVDAGTGEAVWHHAITIEPAWEENESLTTERPFVLRPYRNPIGAGGPGLPRRLVYLDNAPAAYIRAFR